MPSNSSCRAMNVGPLTFQCACLVCVWRSMQSASRALSSSTTLTRVASGMSFFVLNMVRLLMQVLKNSWASPTTLSSSVRRHGDPQRRTDALVFPADDGVVGAVRFQVDVVIVGALEQPANAISIPADQHGIAEADVHVAGQ